MKKKKAGSMAVMLLILIYLLIPLVVSIIYSMFDKWNNDLFSEAGKICTDHLYDSLYDSGRYPFRKYFVPVCRVFNISEQSSGDVVRCVLYYYFAVYLSGNPEWYAGGQYADAA